MKMVNRKGFTMVELLIVLAIIAILAAVAIPVYSSQMEKARVEVDNSNLRAATGIAAQSYILMNPTTGAFQRAVPSGHQVTDDLSYGVYTFKDAANTSGAVSSKNMLVFAYPCSYDENGYPASSWDGSRAFRCESDGSIKPGSNGKAMYSGKELINMPLQQNGGKAKFVITITKGGVVKDSRIETTP